MRKIKVLECIRQGQIGGGESHLLSLLDNIDKDRFEPVVLSFTDGPMVERLRAMQVDTTVIHTERPFDFTRTGAVKKFIREKYQLFILFMAGLFILINLIRYGPFVFWENAT